MTITPSRDSLGGMLSTRRLGRGNGLPKKEVQLDSDILVPTVPFWAGWVLDITYHGGTAQQVSWAQEAVQKCTYPLQALGVKIDVYFSGHPPKSDTRHPYMVTQMDFANHANIYIEPWADDPTAPGNAGLPNAPNNIEEFYKESVVHELGHVAIGCTVGSPEQDTATRQARQTAYAHLFHRIDNPSRHGTLGDWSDVNLAWADEIQETAAEVFKCAFYADKLKLIYKNRTNWTIDDGADWQSFLTLMEPGTFDVMDSINHGSSIAPTGVVDGPVGTTFTQWFLGGSTFILENGRVFYDTSLWSGGRNRETFHSNDGFLDSPPPAPPGNLGHGWAGSGPPDYSETWAKADINDIILAPSLPHAFSRIGYAELGVGDQRASQSSISMGLIDDAYVTRAGITYNWAFTPIGYNTFTAFGMSLLGAFQPATFGVPVVPPCKFFMEIDANAGTATIGVKDAGGNVVVSMSSSTLPKTHSYAPYFNVGGYTMLGDDPQYPAPAGNEVSVVAAGPCTWTTEPTLVSAPYPFKPPGVVPGAQQGGIILLN